MFNLNVVRLNILSHSACIFMSHVKLLVIFQHKQVIMIQPIAVKCPYIFSLQAYKKPDLEMFDISFFSVLIMSLTYRFTRRKLSYGKTKNPKQTKH